MDIIEQKIKEFREKDFILQFFPRSVLQEAYSAKEIKEIDNGTLTREGQNKICEFIEQALKEVRDDTIDEIIKLSEKIELEKGTPDIEEWKAFKHLRNKLRD